MNVASQSPLTPFGVPEKREIRVGFILDRIMNTLQQLVSFGEAH